MRKGWHQWMLWIGAVMIASQAVAQCPYTQVKDRVAVCEKDYHGVIVPCERSKMLAFDPLFLRNIEITDKDVSKAEKLVKHAEVVNKALATLDCRFPLKDYIRFYGGYHGTNYHRKMAIGFLYRSQDLIQDLAKKAYLEESSRVMDKRIDNGGCRYFWVRVDLTDARVEYAQVNGYR